MATSNNNMKKSYLVFASVLGGLTVSSVSVAAISSNSVINIGRNGVAKAAAPTNTRRIWIIDNNGNASETSWWTGSTLYVYYWNANGDGTAKVTNEVLSDYYKGLWYVDLTLTGITTSVNLIFRIGDSSNPYSWGNNNQTFTQPLGAFGGADTIWLNNGVTWDSDNNRNSRQASISTTNGFSDLQLAVVMSKYNTCSSANTNGYNAYPQLDYNFIQKTDSSVFGTKVYGQDTYTIQDYIDGMYARYSA